MKCLTSSDIDRLAAANFDHAWFSRVVGHVKECPECRALLVRVDVIRNGSWQLAAARKESVGRRLYRRILAGFGLVGRFRSWLVVFKRHRGHQDQDSESGEAD